MSRWPGGARAAVSVTVDNLGEAAEIELGLRATDGPLGGHEVGFHAWCHEDWSALDAAPEAANLDRGLAALRAIGIEVAGMRPPGGRITSRTLDLLADRGLRHCSPAGSVPGLASGVAVLPFAWPAVDAFHVLPGFAALRAHVSGSEEPGAAEAVRAALLHAVEDALATGGLAVLVLHNWMIELELDAVRDVLARIRAGVGDGALWATTCREVAAWIGEHPADFPDPPLLDDTSWTDPAHV